MISNFISKINATKKIARERNVHNWHNCLINSVFIIIGISILLTIQTIIHGLNISGETPINKLPIYVGLLPPAYSLVISYLFLDKLIILHIIAFENLNKQVFKLWQRMDMYWFRKYKKHSPITEGLDKIQTKVAKFNSTKSKRQKKLLTIMVITGLVLIQFGLLTMGSESIEQPILTDEETKTIEQNTEYERTKIKINGVNDGGN